MTNPESSTLDIRLDRIEKAVHMIDRVFMHSPQYVDDHLSALLGRPVLIKVETANPVRSFKGHGADLVTSTLERGQRVVCHSTGNFGQAVAYAGRRRGIAVHVFVPTNANPVKLARMRMLGAHVMLVGRDSAESEEAARAYAVEHGEAVFIEDGRNPEIAEGAGTIGIELLEGDPSIPSSYRLATAR